MAEGGLDGVNLEEGVGDDQEEDQRELECIPETASKEKVRIVTHGA